MTRTSTIGTSIRGFTLLELVVVIFIISLFFTLAVPVFRKSEARPDALKMASLLTELNDSAIAMKQNFDITFDLDTGDVSWTGPEGRRSGSFKGLREVDIPSRGAVKEGTLKILFDPQGAPEDINVYMDDRGEKYEVSLNGLSGRVKVSSLENSVENK